MTLSRLGQLLLPPSTAQGFLPQLYARAGDAQALVRMHCAAGDLARAELAAAAPGAAPAAALHLARQVNGCAGRCTSPATPNPTACKGPAWYHWSGSKHSRGYVPEHRTILQRHECTAAMCCWVADISMGSFD